MGLNSTQKLHIVQRYEAFSGEIVRKKSFPFTPNDVARRACGFCLDNVVQAEISAVVCVGLRLKKTVYDDIDQIQRIKSDL